MSGASTLGARSDPTRDRPPAAALALAVVWCHEEPERAGEVAVPTPARPLTLGRDFPSFGRRGAAPTPLRSQHLSRSQLRVAVDRSGGLAIENVGRCSLRVDGVETVQALAFAGAVVELVGELILLVVPAPSPSSDDHPFAGPDAFGIVGEGPAIQALRERIRQVARGSGHVLVLGPSGSGKELVARAIHAASARRERPFVARSAAPLPAGLIDAELFGNVASYPHAGLPARPGLVGEAHRSTLFLDEIGELEAAGQAHLLRVLDGGEYHRLGSARAERADVRVVAATNRAPEELKHDLLARFTLRVEVPPLAERREDLVLLARHLLGRHAAADPSAFERFDQDGWPRLAPGLVLALLERPFVGHLRELERVLLDAAFRSPGDTVEGGEEAQPGPAAPRVPSRAGRLVAALTALAPHDGVVVDEDDGVTVSLLVHPATAFEALASHAEFGSASAAALTRCLGEHPGVTSRRERRAPHRSRRWWRVVVRRAP